MESQKLSNLNGRERAVLSLRSLQVGCEAESRGLLECEHDEDGGEGVRDFAVFVRGRFLKGTANLVQHDKQREEDGDIFKSIEIDRKLLKHRAR